MQEALRPLEYGVRMYVDLMTVVRHWCDWEGAEAYHLNATCRPQLAQPSMPLLRLLAISPSTATMVTAMVNFRCRDDNNRMMLLLTSIESGKNQER